MGVFRFNTNAKYFEFGEESAKNNTKLVCYFKKKRKYGSKSNPTVFGFKMYLIWGS